MKKTMTLILTQGEQEEVVHSILHEATPNSLGAFTPPVTVEHEGVEYIVAREWHLMNNTYIYKPAAKRQIDDLLD